MSTKYTPKYNFLDKVSVKITGLIDGSPASVTKTKYIQGIHLFPRGDGVNFDLFYSVVDSQFYNYGRVNVMEGDVIGLVELCNLNTGVNN